MAWICIEQSAKRLYLLRWLSGEVNEQIVELGIELGLARGLLFYLGGLGKALLQGLGVLLHLQDRGEQVQSINVGGFVIEYRF